MAIINVSFNTKTKKFQSTIDGQPIPNVTSVEVYQDYDDPEKSHIYVGMRETIESEDISVYTSLTAKVKENVAKDIAELPQKEHSVLRGAYALLGKIL